MLRKKQYWQRLFIASILCFVAGFAVYYYMQARRVTPILMYHSISKKHEGSLCVSPENFSRQIKYLVKKGYAVISMDELIDEINNGRRYIPKTVAITFDDGFEDNFTDAFPVLARYGMPATIFVITGYVSKLEEYLTWDQIFIMSKNDITIGGHTRNNEYLPSVKDKKMLLDEIAGCKSDIESRIKRPVNLFCYPLGGFNEDVKKAAKLAGYKGACTTNRGGDRLNRDVYELNRVKITNSDMTKPFHFKAKLSGYYNVFRCMRKGD
jgi:peptidoglycan/xylan/chitin deacetylase (PgdA/CDA1 family)